ncbi:MAG: hypothetical protein WCZ72_07590 [Gemmobacter sp.]
MKLISLHAELFYEAHGDRPYPITFLLALTGQKPFRLCISGSGDTLVIEHAPLPPPHEWEEGRIMHEDVIMLMSPRLHVFTVDRIEAITRENDQIGLSLVAVNEPAFHIWVDGDEFFWGNDQALQWHWSNSDVAPRLGGRISVSGS